MPQLNAFCEWCAGVGGTIASFEGQVLAAPAGGTCFLDNDRVVYNHGTDRWRIMLHNIRTGERTVASEYGANTLYAGGGVWAAWLADLGLFTSTGFKPSGGTPGLLGVGLDGSIAYKPDYFGNGPTMVHELSGGEYKLTDGHAQFLQMYGNRKAVWTEGPQVLRVSGYPQPVVASGGIYRPCIAEVNGRPWISYYSDVHGIVLHPLDSYMGYSVLPTGNGWHTMRTVAPLMGLGVIRFAISRTEGEAPQDVYTVDIDTTNTAKLVDVRTINVPVLNPEVAPLPRKLWVSPFFSHSERYGDTPTSELSGNAITVVSGDPANASASLKRELDRVRPLSFPMIVDGASEVEPININQTIAWWSAGTSMVTLGQSVGFASAKPEKPIIAYLDNRDWPARRPDWLSGRVWPSVQAYRSPGESLESFKAAIEKVLDTVAGYGNPIVLTPRFDDFNGSSTVANILQCMPLYDAWLRKYLVVGFMPFSDRRGLGIAKSPELKAWADAFNKANPARPNRFDYWVPSGSLAGALRNKLQQTTETIVLLPTEKKYLLDLLPKT